jgi:outer membrane lipoprotein carrier protein
MRFLATPLWRMLRAAALAVVIAAVIAAASAAVQTLPLQPLVETLDGRYNSMHSWQADFTQIYTSGLATRTESGTLYLQKPGRMRWNYTRPVGKQFVVNGNHIWQYTAGDNEATVTELKNATDLRTPLRFLLGHTDLNKELDRLSYSGLTPWKTGDVVIHGYPHPDEAGSWREVWIEVTPVYEIDRLLITGVDGSQNDIRLQNIRPNVHLNKDLFDFTPPNGVRVVPAAAVVTARGGMAA